MDDSKRKPRRKRALKGAKQSFLGAFLVLLVLLGTITANAADIRDNVTRGNRSLFTAGDPFHPATTIDTRFPRAQAATVANIAQSASGNGPARTVLADSVSTATPDQFYKRAMSMFIGLFAPDIDTNAPDNIHVGAAAAPHAPINLEISLELDQPIGLPKP